MLKFLNPAESRVFQDRWFAVPAGAFLLAQQVRIMIASHIAAQTSSLLAGGWVEFTLGVDDEAQERAISLAASKGEARAIWFNVMHEAITEVRAQGWGIELRGSMPECWGQTVRLFGPCPRHQTVPDPDAGGCPGCLADLAQPMRPDGFIPEPTERDSLEQCARHGLPFILPKRVN